MFEVFKKAIYIYKRLTVTQANERRWNFWR